MPLVVYLATAMPGVAFWDIGEMQTVPYVLGIPHPTGFPFFVLSAAVFGRLFAFGDPAWRITVFCACASAGAALFAWAFVRSVARSGLAGLGAAFAFAAGNVAWTRAVRADVHDLALACVTAAIVAAERARVTRSPRMLACAAVAIGCGLATHPAAAFALPCVAVLAWPAFASASALERARALLLGIAPLASYAYFPLRSSYVESHGLDPGVDLGLRGSALFDDGSPSSAAHFWRYVSGSVFHPGSALTQAFTPGGLAHVASYWNAVLALQFGVPLLAFAGVGALVLAVRRTRVAAALALLAVVSAPFAANYSVEVDADRYALAVLWAVACVAAIGVDALVRVLVRERSAWSEGFALTALLATIAPNVPAAATAVRDVVAFQDARSIGPGIVRHTFDGSLVIATWNFATPLLYERYVRDSLGSRRIVCGWAPTFAPHFAAWHARFPHVYVVVSNQYDVSAVARPLYKHGRWQLAELR